MNQVQEELYQGACVSFVGNMTLLGFIFGTIGLVLMSAFTVVVSVWSKNRLENPVALRKEYVRKAVQEFS